MLVRTKQLCREIKRHFQNVSCQLHSKAQIKTSHLCTTLWEGSCVNAAEEHASSSRLMNLVTHAKLNYIGGMSKFESVTNHCHYPSDYDNLVKNK